MNTNLQFDTKAYLESTVQQIQKTIDFAYPFSKFDSSKAHTSLMEIQGILRGLRSVVDNMKPPALESNIAALPVTKE